MTRAPRGPMERVLRLADQLGLSPDYQNGQWRMDCSACSEEGAIQLRRADDGRIALRPRCGCDPSCAAAEFLEAAEAVRVEDRVAASDLADIGGVA